MKSKQGLLVSITSTTIDQDKQKRTKQLFQLTGVLLLLVTLLACSCKKEDKTSSPSNNNSNGTNNNTAQGKGGITLVCNGHTFVNAGNCNYSSIADCIVVVDSNNNANAFTINLDGGLPSGTKTYSLRDAASGTENASMSFVRFPSGSMFNWEATNSSGSVTLTTEGNKITCTFSNVPLAPSTVYNPNSLNHDGICSGSFILYK